tara:strand:- start:540 stop:1418 length:879 start_codon:yes stop_codon:yes gene_type:complete
MNNRLLLVAAALLIVAGIAGVILLTPGESAETATVPFAIPEPAPEPISGTNDLSDDDPSEGMIGSGEALPGSVPVQPIPKEPLKEPEVPAVVLPRLDDSDPLFRDSVVTLSRIEAVNGWLGGNNLIRKTVLVVDNLARGTLIREPLAILTPTEPFSAIELAEDEFELNPASYRRFDRVTEIFDSLDSRRTAELYVLLHPLFEEAWRELGYREGRFQTVLFQAVGRLLETPEIEGAIPLVRPAVMYEFADDRLESLGSAQKQLLRMGPDNTRTIKRKLRELALEVRAQLAEDD